MVPLVLMLGACGGDSSAGNGGIDIADYFLPATSSVLTWDSYSVSDNVIVYNSTSSEDMVVNGNEYLITNSSGNTLTATITDTSIDIVTSDISVSYKRFADQGDIIFNDELVADINLKITLSAMHETIQIDTGLGVSGQTYNDVLELTMYYSETTINGGSDLYSKYYAKGIGEIGYVDRDCTTVSGSGDSVPDSECLTLNINYAIRR